MREGSWGGMALRLAAVGLAYYAFARLGLLIPYVGTHVSLVWLPTGIAVAAFLRWGQAMLPAVYLAALAANLAIGGPAWMAAGVAGGNTLGTWLSARLLQRWGFEPSLVRRKDLALYLLAVAAGMLVTASNGTAWRWAAGLLPGPLWTPAWLTWWTGDAVGALLGGVPLVALSRGTWQEAFAGRAAAINLGLLAAVAVCGGVVFSPAVRPGSALTVPLLVLPLFLSALLAMRSGALAASIAVLLLSLAAASGTAQGSGPFAGSDGHAGLLALWSYLTALACTGLLIWVLAAELLSSRRQLEALFVHASDGVLMIDHDERVRAVNPVAAALLNLDARAAVGRALADLPQGRGTLLSGWLARHRAAPSPGGEDLSFPQQDGPPRIVEPSAARFQDASGRWHTNLVLRDVSARRDAEARLQRREHRLRAITDNMPALICYLDRELRFRFVNATYRDWFGVDPAAMIGMPMQDFVAPGQVQARETLMRQTLRDAQRLSFELEVQIHGQPRHLRSLYVPDRGDDGQVQGLFVLTMDITESKNNEDKLSRMASYDHLTGLLNRHAFEAQLTEALAASARSGSALALLFLDIDHFKRINDQRGHAAGDAVLREFAQRLQAAVRGSDTVGRLAGDEFVILLEQVRGVEQAERVAAKVCAAMTAPFSIDGAPVAVRASVGVAWADGTQPVTVESLLATADAALYEAKHAGRDTYRLRRTGHPGDGAP
ncbi:MAG: diguanylate cyclase [Burkholderiaceae bacterium]